MQLSSENIDFIIKDLNKRGLLLDELRDEVIDHVCSAVEDEMNKGTRFMDAYLHVIKAFGNNEGLIETQKETIQSRHQHFRNMLKSYFTIAIRNLMKQRFYTAINVVGLAVGIAACLVIILYVNNELSYDKHNKDYERIYRVNNEIKFGSNHLIMATTPAPMAETLMKDFPEVEVAGRFWDAGSYLIKKDDQSYKEPHCAWADSAIFSIFTMPIVEGDQRPLRDPNTMAISRSAAQKYFPGTSAVGQSLLLENKENFKVSAVFEDFPETSHFKFDFLFALVSREYNKDQNWLSNNFNTYLKLREGSSGKDLEAKFPKMVDVYAGPQAKAALGGDFSMEKFRASGNKIEFTLIPIADIHLYSDRMVELGVNSDITYIYLFSAVALFILLIACINFMNLSTARSANRAKEVGIRKVMGSFRSHLIRQFLTESTLLSIFSFLLAIGIAWAILPSFNSLSTKNLLIPFGSGIFWISILSGAIVVGLLAGLYPSFFLSAFRPVNVLKGNLALGMKSGFVRSALVVFQFWISITLVVGTIAVNRQLNFIQTKKIGFNKDQVLIVNDAYGLGDQLQSFKNEVTGTSGIISGTISGFLPVSGTGRSDNTHWPEGAQPTEENMISLQCWRVDYDYVKTMGMKIVSGRDFSREFPSDSSAIIINQSAARLFGFTDPIGKKISTFAGQPNGADFDSKSVVSYPVVGVVEDFHYESLKQTIGPVAFFLQRSSALVSFRFEAKNTQQVVSNVESIWKRIAPGMPFSYTFLDESFNKMYSAEQRLGEIFMIFAGLAIIIACLGLFALTAFTAEQRTKEIGIRKVLGASVSGIVVLLSKEFGKLIVISFVLAAPVAWYGISWWLESYTYKTEVGIMVYVAAGFSAFLIAWLTMSFQSIRAAMANPIKSLRSE